MQWYHSKYGDRFFYEHGNQAGSFSIGKLKLHAWMKFNCIFEHLSINIAILTNLMHFNECLRQYQIWCFNQFSIIIYFNLEQLSNIRETSTSARFICKTTDTRSAQINVFMFPSLKNPEVDCDELPEIDYSLWRDDYEFYSNWIYKEFWH